MLTKRFQRKINFYEKQFFFTEIIEKYSATFRRDEGIHLNIPSLL